MVFRTSLAATILLSALAIGWTPAVQAADRLDSGLVDVAKVKAALRTATPEEDGFIEYVVGRVNDGTLPRKLFEGTFIWAKRKSYRKFQYFKHALILRAAKAGIDLRVRGLGY